MPISGFTRDRHHRFGFAILTRAADGWSADFRDLAGASLFRCQIAPGQVGCN
jgi:hypothetical protein